MDHALPFAVGTFKCLSPVSLIYPIDSLSGHGDARHNEEVPLRTIDCFVMAITAPKCCFHGFDRKFHAQANALAHAPPDD